MLLARRWIPLLGISLLVISRNPLFAAESPSSKTSQTHTNRPFVQKLGTIDRDLVETTPIVFNQRLYRFEWVREGYWNNQRKVNYPVVAVFSIGMAYIIAVTWSVASDILYESYDWTVHTLHPGLSSIGTTICILALVHVGVMESTHRRQCNGVRTFTAIILFSVAILTVIGYITGNYYLAFFWPKISTGVTLHTAACFILLGWAIMIPVVFPLHSSEMIVSHNGQRFVRPLSSTSRLYSPSDN